MDCNELLRRQLANRLLCQSQQIAVGPAGPTGSPGPTGPTGSTGSTGPTGSPAPTIAFTKSFTIFVDYTVQDSISRVSIPAGLFTNPLLSAGGVFTTNVGTDLIFRNTLGAGLDTITCANTTNAFVITMSMSGYAAAGQWNPIPSGNIRPTLTHYAITTDNSVQILGLNLTNLNGGNTAVRPTTGVAAGFLATITLFYY
jgi:hypothetical protein